MVQTCYLRPDLFLLGLTWWSHWQDLLLPFTSFSPSPHLIASRSRFDMCAHNLFSFISPDGVTVQTRDLRPHLFIFYLTWWRHSQDLLLPFTPFSLNLIWWRHSQDLLSPSTPFSQSYMMASQSRIATSIQPFLYLTSPDGDTVQTCYLRPDFFLLNLIWWRHDPNLRPPFTPFSPWPYLMASRSSFAMSVHTFLSFTRRRTMGTSLSLGHAPRLICFSRVNSLQDMALKLIRCSRNNVANRQVKFQGAMTKTNI